MLKLQGKKKQTKTKTKQTKNIDSALQVKNIGNDFLTWIPLAKIYNPQLTNDTS